MKKWIIGIIIVAILGALVYIFGPWRNRGQTAQGGDFQTEPASRGGLTATVGATGVVHANQTAILNWQTTGSVGTINVSVGYVVSAEEILANVEQTSLPQTIILAQADLVSAQKALDDLLNSQMQQAQALQAVDNARQALENARNPELVQARALEAIAQAEKAVENAERAVRWAQSPASQSYIDEAQAQVVLVKDQLDRAKERYAPYENKPEDNLTRARLLSELAAAQQQYDFAVRQLNSLQGPMNATDLAVQETNLATAQAQLLEAQREWERIKDGPNPADMAVLEAQFEDAQREYERVKDGADPADVVVAQARVDAAQATLNLARITAPFDGVVTQVNIKPGDQVSPGIPAFRIDDISHLLVDVQVSEVDINRIQVGQQVILTFDAILNQEYHGVVNEVALVGTTTQGIVDFTVTVELTDADEVVKPGMTAAVNIVVDQLEDVLLVPNRAVRVVEGERVVYILKSGAPQKVVITLGASSDMVSEVVGGELQEGDAVILNPPTIFDTNGPPPFVHGG